MILNSEASQIPVLACSGGSRVRALLFPASARGSSEVQIPFAAIRRRFSTITFKESC